MTSTTSQGKNQNYRDVLWMAGLLKDLRQWSASKRVQPTGTTLDGQRSELGCVAFLSPVPERRSKQPPLLSSRDAPELGLGGPDGAGRPPSAQHYKSVYSFRDR